MIRAKVIKRLCWAAMPIQLLICHIGYTQQMSADTEWILQVADLNADNTDFSDFEGLKEAIGSKRIVLLGEQTHGDGSTFKAKVRIIKFLHEQMGFDLLVFENGFYQGQRLWNELKAGVDYQTAFKKGMHPRWSGVQQIQPLFSYIQKSIKTSSPLRVAGLDCIFEGDYFRDDFMDDLRTTVSDHSSLNNDLSVKRTMAFLSGGPYPRDVNKSEQILADFDEFIDKLRAEDETPIQWNNAAFWAQTLKNCKVNTINNWSRKGSDYDRWRFFSRRCEMMADNLIELMDRDKKVIVWAATNHNMRQVDPRLLISMGWDSRTKFMGEYLSESLGSDKMFLIAFTGYEGTYRDVYSGTNRRFETPSSGSLEGRLNALNVQNAYFMLKGELSPDWLSKPFTASMVFNQEHKANWSQSIDAILFTQHMEASKGN